MSKRVKAPPNSTVRERVALLDDRRAAFTQARIAERPESSTSYLNVFQAFKRLSDAKPGPIQNVYLRELGRYALLEC